MAACTSPARTRRPSPGPRDAPLRLRPGALPRERPALPGRARLDGRALSPSLRHEGQSGPRGPGRLPEPRGAGLAGERWHRCLLAGRGDARPRVRLRARRDQLHRHQRLRARPRRHPRGRGPAPQPRRDQPGRAGRASSAGPDDRPPGEPGARRRLPRRPRVLGRPAHEVRHLRGPPGRCPGRRRADTA